MCHKHQVLQLVYNWTIWMANFALKHNEYIYIWRERHYTSSLGEKFRFFFLYIFNDQTTNHKHPLFRGIIFPTILCQWSTIESLCHIICVSNQRNQEIRETMHIPQESTADDYPIPNIEISWQTKQSGVLWLTCTILTRFRFASTVSQSKHTAGVSIHMSPCGESLSPSPVPFTYKP